MIKKIIEDCLSQSLINQGNILTYYLPDEIKHTTRLYVAIPYKSGKYSYLG